MSWVCLPGQAEPVELGEDHGTAHGPGQFAHYADLANPQIVIVSKPPNWVPACELDSPAMAEVQEIVLDYSGDPITFIRQFNGASSDSGGSIWAALAFVARVGEQAKLLSALSYQVAALPT
jgi:hypothetical protein